MGNPIEPDTSRKIMIEKVDVKCGFLCNNRCLFCVQGNKRTQIGDIPTPDIIQTLEKARSEAHSVVLTGGEVTIKPDFLQLVNKAGELGFRHIQIQTNGRMFAIDDFCDKTIRAGANDFSVALHGHTPALHDYLTQSKGAFYQTVKGIKNLKKRGQRVGLNIVVNRSNFRNLPSIAALAIRLQVDQYQFAFVHALGTAGKNFSRIVPRYTLIEPYVKKGLSLGILAGKSVMTEAIPYCMMSGYYPYVAERIIPKTKIYDVGVIDDYTDYRVKEGKLKGEHCTVCRFNAVCEGPWKEYSERYGFFEFRPVLNPA